MKTYLVKTKHPYLPQFFIVANDLVEAANEAVRVLANKELLPESVLTYNRLNDVKLPKPTSIKEVAPFLNYDYFNNT